MAKAKQLVENATNSQEDTPEVIYTSPQRGFGTLITAFTASNNANENRSYKAYIVNKDDEPLYPQRPYRIVIWGDIDLGSGIEGQVVPAGGSIYVECNQPNSVYFTLSGKEL